MDEKAPETIEMNEEEFSAFKKRLEQNSLSSDDKNLILRLFQVMLWMNRQLENGRLTIARLKRLIFGEKTESRKNILKNDPREPKQGTTAQGTEEEVEKKSDDTEKTKGHGRNGQGDYPGAEKVVCTHPQLKVGDICPKCGKGKLHDSVKSGVFIRFTGSPLISATIYSTQKLRCGLCGETFEAPLPEGVKAEKWDETADTTIALARYGYGFPFYRLEKFQKDVGVPVADSVAFERAENVADSAFPVYKHIVSIGAQGNLVEYDDTTAIILDLIKENKSRDHDKDRVGMFTTAMISRAQGREIVLFFTGRNHAGENIAELLKKRIPGFSPPKLLFDGSAMNPPKEFEALLANCLGHARRNFVDITNDFPQEVCYVIDTFAQIFHFDASAKEKGMNDEERLKFHQEKSGPLMEQFKTWCKDQLENRKTEPNGPLGKAIKYMLKRWDKLTLFLKVPGVPLSTNTVERAIKTCVLHRKASLFYKTLHGAAIGDILMTMIQTAIKAKKSPLHYLNALHCNRRAAKENPEAWLPWNYEATLAKLSATHA
jgi:hypothetical protein